LVLLGTIGRLGLDSSRDGHGCCASSSEFVLGEPVVFPSPIRLDFECTEGEVGHLG